MTIGLRRRTVAALLVAYLLPILAGVIFLALWNARLDTQDVALRREVAQQSALINELQQRGEIPGPPGPQGPPGPTVTPPPPGCVCPRTTPRPKPTAVPTTQPTSTPAPTPSPRPTPTPCPLPLCL